MAVGVVVGGQAFRYVTGRGKRDLLSAIDAADTSRVAVLLGRGADVNAKDRSGTTPMLSALERTGSQWDGPTYEAILRLLLDHDTNVDPRSPSGNLAWYAAACNGHVPMLERLLAKGVDVDQRPDFLVSGNPTDTALMAAARRGRKAAVDFLIAHGANVNATSIGPNGATPLTRASGAPGDRADIVAVLLSHGARVNDPDASGANALWWAVSRGSLRTVRMLLDHGADLRHGGGRDAMTPLHVAVTAGNEDLTDLLIRKGASVAARDRHGQTALDLAMLMHRYATLQRKQFEHIIAVLRKAGAKA